MVRQAKALGWVGTSEFEVSGCIVLAVRASERFMRTAIFRQFEHG